MEDLFGILVLASFVLFVIGIFRPKTSLFWDKEKATRKKSALIYGGMTFLSFILFGITADKKPFPKNVETNNAKIENNSNPVVVNEPKLEIKKTVIKKLKSKRESRNDGEYNQMTLFFVDNSITQNELKEFCESEKSNYSNGYFQILVFFKEKKAVRFPDNPLVGGFFEEKDLTNIKAIYTINNSNGYSKLDYYDDNAYSSSPQSIDIE